MANFDSYQFQENISNHPLFLDTLYNGGPSQIADNIVSILQYSLDRQALVKRILISQRIEPK